MAPTPPPLWSPFCTTSPEPKTIKMKTLVILLIGATVFMAGCACDCDDRLGNNATRIENNTDADGVYSGTDMERNGNNLGTTTGETGTTNDPNRGNTTTNAGNNLDGTNNTTGANDGNKSNAAPKTDPRTYSTSGGGMGYRTDTINEYDGEDGTARDKNNHVEGTKPK